jgi:HK97 family phage portal protein
MSIWDWGYRAISGFLGRWNLDGTGYVGMGGGTNAGIPIDRDIALTSATFFACMNLVGSTIATLGFEVMQRNRDGSRVVLSDHPVNQVIAYEPTLHHTACEYWQRAIWDQELSGNAFARLSRTSRGELLGFIEWRPDRVSLDAGNPARWRYQFKEPVGGGDWIDEKDGQGNCQIFHLRNFSIDGRLGIATPDIARQALGLDLAVEKYGAMFFGKGGRVKDIFKVDGVPDKTQREKFRQIFRESYGNTETFHEAMLLEKGMDLVGKSGATPNEAQFLETQVSSSLRLCRFVGVPPTLVGILDRATYSNNEQLMQQFVTLSLANRIKRIEDSARRALFTQDEKRKGLYIHSNVNKLMRGDSIARGTYYKTMMSLGVMAANEVRDLEDMARIDDPAADEYRRAQNIFGPDTPADAGADTQQTGVQAQ